MNKHSAQAAADAAQRFLAAYRELEVAEQVTDQANDVERRRVSYLPENSPYSRTPNLRSSPYAGSVESGAARRASLDLTRSLAVLRRADA